MVERADERFVLGSSRSAMKRSSASRASDNRLAAHAVADVEQHADAHGHALVGELRDRLLRRRPRKPRSRPCVRPVISRLLLSVTVTGISTVVTLPRNVCAAAMKPRRR